MNSIIWPGILNFIVIRDFQSLIFCAETKEIHQFNWNWLRVRNENRFCRNWVYVYTKSRSLRFFRSPLQNDMWLTRPLDDFEFGLNFKFHTQLRQIKKKASNESPLPFSIWKFNIQPHCLFLSHIFIRIRSKTLLRLLRLPFHFEIQINFSVSVILHAPTLQHKALLNTEEKVAIMQFFMLVLFSLSHCCCCIVCCSPAYSVSLDVKGSRNSLSTRCSQREMINSLLVGRCLVSYFSIVSSSLSRLSTMLMTRAQEQRWKIADRKVRQHNI